MQHSSIHTAYRHRSPNLSDSDEADRASSSSSSSHQHNPAASSSSSATTIVNLQQQQQQQRPQRPHLQHKHTASGSFKRIKRKNTPATSPTPPATVDHQQPAAEQTTVKTCFICYGDSNEEDSSALSSGSVLGGSTSAPRKWIHPCKCSLVAHEDCLLHWVQISKPTASRSTPASCPQCNTPYTMHQLDYPLLSFIERIESIWTRNVSKLLMVGIGVGSWTLLGLYGLWSIRLLAGDKVAEQLFLRKSTRWLTAPLVLPVIVLSRTHLLDSILPFLPLTLILNSTLPNTHSFYTTQPYLLTDLQMSFPPSPALTLCVLPWIRAAYMALRRRIFRTILGQARPTPLATPASPGALNAHVENGDADRAAQLPGEADFARNHQRNEGDGHGVEAMFNDHTGERRIVVTVGSGARILAGSLVFPYAAAGIGSLLLWLAKRQTASGRWLAKLLGVGLAASSAGGAVLGLSNRFVTRAPEYVDPVWWRNAIGGALLVLGKDIWSLTRQIMERKRADSRKIEDQPFRQSMDI